MPRTEKQIIDEMRVEAAAGCEPLVLEELARELLELVVPPPRPPDMFLDIRMKGDLDPDTMGYLIDHVRAKWVVDRPPSHSSPMPLRNVAGDVIGSWTWGWLQNSRGLDTALAQDLAPTGMVRESVPDLRQENRRPPREVQGFCRLLGYFSDEEANTPVATRRTSSYNEYRKVDVPRRDLHNRKRELQHGR